jgi:hypothetical protein
VIVVEVAIVVDMTAAVTSSIHPVGEPAHTFAGERAEAG